MQHLDRSLASLLASLIFAAALGAAPAGPPRPSPAGGGGAARARDTATFRDGVDAFERGETRRALTIFRRLAEEGDANAMLNVGMLVRAEDPGEAGRWFERAARAGDRNGAYELGLAHLNRELPGASARTGIAWIVVATKTGQPAAARVLGRAEREFPRPEVQAARELAADLMRELDPPRGRGRGADASRSAGRPVSASGRPTASGGDGRTLTMKSAEVTDPEMDGIRSHELLVPEGWTLRGDVRWSPELAYSFVNLDLAVAGSDGREVRVFPNGAFTYFESSAPTGMATPAPGSNQAGRIWLAPMSSADFVVHQVLRLFRPGASDVRVVSVDEVADVAAEWRRVFEPLLRSQEENNAMWSSMGANAGSSMRIDAPVVRVRYREDGREFDEEVCFVHLEQNMSMDNFGARMRTTNWQVHDVKSIRAPAGRLDDERPLLRTVLGSVRPTRDWQARVDDLGRELARIQHRTSMMAIQEIRKRSRRMFETNEEIRAMHRDSWEKYQASSDRLARAWSNAIKGVDDYVLPDGTTRSLDSTYERVFTNGIGEFVFTDDLTFDPNVHSSQEWSSIEKVTPMGGAANW